MRQHRVTVSETGLLLATLKRALPLMPVYALREALKKRDILINGRRTGLNVRVVQGDELQLYTPYQELGIPIVYEDEQYLIVNKPAGINTDENARSESSLIKWAAEKAIGAYTPQLCHRLDNKTSGLVILAKNQESVDLMREAIASHEVTKIYECLVLGSPKPPAQTCAAWLIKDAKAARVRIINTFTAEAKQIITEYQTKQAGQVSRLLVTLHTGRTHQIRAHLAFLGYPVMGDDVYGDREANREFSAPGLMLCATRLEFSNLCGIESLQGKRFEINPPF